MPAVMEWLVLALLVPAIVVPVVLLWGFSGCSFLFRPAVDSKTFEAELAPGPPEFEPQRRCVVLRVEKPIRGGGKLTLTLRGSPINRLKIERVTVSRPAAPGDPYDSEDADLTPVAESVWLPKDDPIKLDEISYSLNPEQPLLVAFDLGVAFEFGARVRAVNAPSQGVRVRDAPDGNTVARWQEGSQGQIVNGPQTGTDDTWWEVQLDEEVNGQSGGWVGEQNLALSGDVYHRTGVPSDEARTFHAAGLEEAAIADRRPSVADPGAPYDSLGSIYLVERIDAS